MSLDMSRICDVCAQRVGKNSEVIRRDRDGGWDHAWCHSKEGHLLAMIFGEQVEARGREASRQLAHQSGHTVTKGDLRREPGKVTLVLSCTCGWKSPWIERHTASRVRAEHLHDAALAQPSDNP